MSQIVEVFNEFSTNHNQKFSLSDILSFLDSKCESGHFDRDVYQQLIDQISTAEKFQQCSINELIGVFKKAQNVLNDKINKCQLQINQKNIEIRAYNDKLQNSVNSTNRLNVDILDAEILYQGNGQLQLSVECSGSIVYTQLCRRVNPVWNESFEFNIVDEKSFLKFTLLDTELQQKRGIGGISYLELTTFSDQMLHDIWVNVTDESNNSIRGKLHLKIQWIYSKTKYLQDIISENNLSIHQLEQEMNDHMIDLDIINQPFKGYKINNNYQTNLTISTYQTQQQNVQQNPVSEHQMNRLVQISLWLIILYLIFGLLNSFYRTLYFDYLVIFYCFLFYKKNYKLQSLLHIKVIMALLGVALLLDIIWLSIYSTPYFGEFNAHYDHFEYGLQKYQVVISWLLLIVKIGVLVFYVHIYSSYPDKDTQVYDQQWKSLFGQDKSINVYRNY